MRGLYLYWNMSLRHFHNRWSDEDKDDDELLLTKELKHDLKLHIPTIINGILGLSPHNEQEYWTLEVLEYEYISYTSVD